MTEKVMGKCNKCGAEYEAAPVGVIHKCGRCEGGRVQVPVRALYSPDISIPPISLHISNNDYSYFTTRESVEKEICDYLLGKTDLPHHGIDPHTAKFIAEKIISNRRYLGREK